MSDKKYLFLLSVLILLPLVLAADSFTLYNGESPDAICPGSTELYIDYVENTGNSDLEFTMSTSGSASSFTTSVPQGFLLQPGKIKAIYTYLTPRTTTPVGNYDIKLIANSNQGSDSITHPVNVIDCYDYQLQALEDVKHTCPGDSQNFNFRLTNNGQFLDTYTLDLGGEFASRTSLSNTQFSLSPGQSKDFSASVETGENDEGEHTFTTRVRPQLGTSIQAATSTLMVDPCYDFKLQTDQDFLEFCENSQRTVPITVQNQGSTSNIFNLNLNGPEWANINKNKLDIAEGGTGTVDLILAPAYGVQGAFQVEFTAEPERGNVKAMNTFNVNIKKCHSVNIDIERDADRICNSLENTYSVLVRNDGEFEKEYNIEVEGPDWATLDKRSLSLTPGQEDELTLNINPPFNVIPATYSIKVKATATDSNIVADTDEIALSAVTRDECFQAIINAEEKDVKLPYDTTATVPIIIENRGTYTGTYDLSITGTASDFTYLNPSIITIDPTKSEIVYLYIAPTGQIANGDYSITVSARLGESAILATETINIKVTESKAPTEEDIEREVVEEQTESFFQRAINFIVGLFTPDKPTEEDTTEEETEDTEEEEEVVEDETEEPTLEELTLRNIKLTEGGSEQFLIDGEEHQIEYTQTDGDSIKIIVQSDPQELDLNPGESKKVDLDNDGVYDLLVTFNSYTDGEADITYERIEEIIEELEDIEDTTDEIDDALDDEVVDDTTDETEDDTTEEDNNNSIITGASTTATNAWDSIKKTFTPIIGNLSQSIILYRNQIIAIIIILLIILIAAKTQFHRKIVKFFEEEIEEEPVIKEIKTVEPEKKKEEKKKEEKKPEKKQEDKKEKKKEEPEPEKKEEKKPDDDEEEDFIIEFDDEED